MAVAFESAQTTADHYRLLSVTMLICKRIGLGEFSVADFLNRNVLLAESSAAASKNRLSKLCFFCLGADEVV